MKTTIIITIFVCIGLIAIAQQEPVEPEAPASNAMPVFSDATATPQRTIVYISPPPPIASMTPMPATLLPVTQNPVVTATWSVPATPMYDEMPLRSAGGWLRQVLQFVLSFF